MEKFTQLLLIAFAALLAVAEDEFAFDGKRAFPTNAYELAVNSGNWYGLYTNSSNVTYLVCASLDSTNFTAMLSFPTNSTKTELGGGGDSINDVISSEAFTNAVRGVVLNPVPQTEDTDELSPYGSFGSIAAAVAALIAVVAALHRSRMQQDTDGSYYFEVEEPQS